MTVPSPAAADTPLRCCGVCLLAPVEGFALVACGHARFCENCARRVADEGGNCPLCSVQSWNQHGDARFRIRHKIAVVMNSHQLGLDICDWNWNCNVNYNTGTHDVLWSLYNFFCLSYFNKYNCKCGIIYVFRFVLETITCRTLKFFLRMQYIRLLLFYSVIFQSYKFQSPVRQTVEPHLSSVSRNQVPPHLLCIS